MSFERTCAVWKWKFDDPYCHWWVIGALFFPIAIALFIGIPLIRMCSQLEDY